MPIIQVPTPNLDTSLNFYKKLGFHTQYINQNVLLSGGNKLEILIDTKRFSRVGLRFYRKDWSDFLTSNDFKHTKNEEGFLIISPGGCPVYLIENNPLDAAANFPDIIPGNYMGLSIETNDMTRSLAFWEAFGFQQNAGNLEHGWASLIDDKGFGISLMQYHACPHLFFNPSLTFFNGKNNPDIIKKIRDLDIPITEEITVFNEHKVVDNIIIQDPSGLGFFIFND
jgi:predicted lactoylglutathione lyase